MWYKICLEILVLLFWWMQDIANADIMLFSRGKIPVSSNISANQLSLLAHFLTHNYLAMFNVILMIDWLMIQHRNRKDNQSWTQGFRKQCSFMINLHRVRGRDGQPKQSMRYQTTALTEDSRSMGVKALEPDLFEQSIQMRWESWID